MNLSGLKKFQSCHTCYNIIQCEKKVITVIVLVASDCLSSVGNLHEL